MSSVAAYKSTVRIGGTPIGVADEESQIIHPNFIRIDQTGDKYAIDSTQPVSVQDGDFNSLTVVDINYLEGVIKIFEDTSILTSPFRLTYNKIPLSFVGGSKEYSLEIGGDVLDDTAFHNDINLNPGFRSRQLGLVDVSASFSKWDNVSRAIINKKLNRERFLLDIRPGGGKTSIRGWFVIETDGLSGDVGALEEQAVSLQLAGDVKTNFSYAKDWTVVEARLKTRQEIEDNYFLT